MNKAHFLLLVLAACLPACIKPGSQPAGAGPATATSLYTLSLTVVQTDSVAPGDSGIADNSTFITIRVQTTDTNLLRDSDRVIFSTTKGVFSNNADTISAKWAYYYTNDTPYTVAYAYLKDRRPEQATVTASLADTVSFSNTAIVNFKPAYPDAISLTCDSAVLTDSISNSTPVFATLLRNYGHASAGLLVYFSDTKNAGVFSANPVPADTNGIASATFTLIDTANLHYQRDTIIAKVLGAADSGMNTIYLR